MQLTELEKRIWLLHLASADPVELWTLALSANDWPDVPMPTFNVSEVLSAMLRDGEIYIEDEAGTVQAGAMANELIERRDGEYGLTETGGAIWERQTRANWAKRAVCSLRWPNGPDSEQHVEIISLDLDAIRDCLKRLGYASNQVRDIELDAIGSWKPTYWKTLESGHRLRFIIPRDVVPCPDSSAGDWGRWFETPGFIPGAMIEWEEQS
jgi:hypothetical protein